METALIMAGGQSARMRATGGPAHKALVPVLGVPLLERNLCRLLDCGFSNVAVSVSAHEQSLRDYLSRRGRALARAREADLVVLEEQRPLGTIGVMRELRDAHDPVLVVNSDNLTGLDLRAFMEHHRREQAAVTIAVHREPVRIPYGQVTVDAGRVVAYAEKPVHEVVVSSGTYVFDPAVAAVLGADERCNLPELVALADSAGGFIAAYEHAALWIDVNDMDDLRRCEDLVSDNADVFERWERSPDRHTVDLLMRMDGGVIVERGRDGGAWALPTRTCGNPAVCDAGVAQPWPGGGDALKATPLTAFDDVDVDVGGALVRHHVFELPCRAGALDEADGGRVRSFVAADAAPAGLGSPLRRALAYASRAR